MIFEGELTTSGLRIKDYDHGIFYQNPIDLEIRLKELGLLPIGFKGLTYEDLFVVNFDGVTRSLSKIKNGE